MNGLIQDSYAKLTDEDLNRWEEEIGAKLPEGYRRFLLTHNGGCLKERVVYSGKNKYGGTVDEFLALELDANANGGDLRWNYQTFVKDGRMPAELIPIADTPLGDVICLGISKERWNQVYLWNHEEEAVEGEPGYDNVEFVAPSFEKYLAHFKIDESFEGEERLPAFHAAERGNGEKLRQALQAGGTVEDRNDRGLTLVMCAVWHRQLEVVQVLRDLGADLEAVDPEGSTALYWAINAHSVDGSRMLLDAGANIDAANSERDTPLIHAIQCSSFRIARMLIERDANVHAENNAGETALSLCQGEFFAERSIVPLLRARGAIK